MTAKLAAQLPEISSNLLGGRRLRAEYDLMERRRASHDEARELAQCRLRGEVVTSGNRS